jgi:hypothetical protein
LSVTLEHEQGRSFSVKMTSKKHVKNLNVSDEAIDRVLIEANISNLIGLPSVDGMVLEARGTKSILRVDLTEKELEAMFSKVRSKLP